MVQALLSEPSERIPPAISIPVALLPQQEKAVPRHPVKVRLIDTHIARICILQQARDAALECYEKSEGMVLKNQGDVHPELANTVNVVRRQTTDSVRKMMHTLYIKKGAEEMQMGADDLYAMVEKVNEFMVDYESRLEKDPGFQQSPHAVSCALKLQQALKG